MKRKLQLSLDRKAQSLKGGVRPQRGLPTLRPHSCLVPRKRTRTSGSVSDLDHVLTLGCRKITRAVPSLRVAFHGFVACDLRCLWRGRQVGLTVRAWCWPHLWIASPKCPCSQGPGRSPRTVVDPPPVGVVVERSWWWVLTPLSSGWPSHWPPAARKCL